MDQFEKLKQELRKPTPYVMELVLDGETRRFKLKFRIRYQKTKTGKGMDGYLYSFNGRTYQDVTSLWKEKTENLSETVEIGTDEYGEKVLRTYTEIPTFDFGDREWGSREREYLFFDGKDIQLVVMRGGYRIASLTFYEELVFADIRMKPLLTKLGWPLAGIQWEGEM